MRILLAYDLSPEAERALAAVASQPWSAGTVVRLVTSPLRLGARPSSFDRPTRHISHARHVRTAIEAAHESASALLHDRGFMVETAILSGAPAKAVVEHARDVAADLVVVGAASRGALSAAVLGSVSAEIARRSRCSVLVVRVEALDRVLLATDGSPSAETAARATMAWPLFAESSIRIVAVAPPPSRYTEIAVPREPAAHLVDQVAAITTLAGAHANALAKDLSEVGRLAETDVRTGEPASEIVAAALEWPADLVVVGSRGTSIMRRLLLGSVARAVFFGVNCSVLVVR